MELISIPEIAETHNGDESQIRKVVKMAKIKVHNVYRESTKKSATAIAKSDLKKLLKAMPSLTVRVAESSDVPVTQVASEIAKLRGWKAPDVTTVLRMCEARGIKFTEAKVGNRPVKVINRKDYQALMKEVNAQKVA
jgi:hypothetical protein